MIHISQGQLNLLETCPRKFQHLYLEQLGFPTSPEQQERLDFGHRFHLLMQQRELGLPFQVVPLDRPLQQSVEAFVQATPDLFQASPTALRQSEHRRTLEWQGYLITVIYDLLILAEEQAQILDWKTYPRPQNSRWLAQNWQTRLYPFVLAETSSYRADQISMTYWFIQLLQEEVKPQHLRFQYTEELHQQIGQALSDRLTQLTQWLQDYEMGKSLPQVAESAGCCPNCSFALRCQRGQNQKTAPVEPFNLAEIEEVAL